MFEPVCETSIILTRRKNRNKYVIFLECIHLSQAGDSIELVLH